MGCEAVPPNRNGSAWGRIAGPWWDEVSVARDTLGDGRASQRATNSLLPPALRLCRGVRGRLTGVAALAASAVALGAAPAVLDGSYSWLEHTTSESGAQGVHGAWLARTGFVLFGLAVLWISNQQRDRWRQPAVALHVTFAVCMFLVAAFSLRSWKPGVGYDPTEDLLHSVAATVMGFAFALGVSAVAIRLHSAGHPWRSLDALAVVASVALPIGMAADGSIDGVLQRVMFAIAYIWYGREAWPKRETEPVGA